MLLIFESLLPVFLIVALGWLLRRYGVIKMEQWEGIEQLGFWVLFPTLLFHALVNADLKSLALNGLIMAYVTALIILCILLWLVYLKRRDWFGINGPAYSSIFQTSSRWNAFIALAVMDKLAGPEGLAIVAVVMSFTVLPLNVINILVVAHTASTTATSWKNTLTIASHNPMIWGAFIGLVVNLLAIPVYEPLLVGTDLIARAGLGVGLLAVGAGLRIRSVFNPRPDMWMGLVGKMLLFPATVFVLCQAFGLSGVTLTAAVLCASVPTAMNGYIVARKMGGDAELYATTSAAQTLLGLVSIPFFLWLTI